MAAAVRVYEAAGTPLVLDEIYALTLTRGGPRGILHTLARDIDQPLNCMLLWAWRAIGGEGERWIKLLPILIGVLTVLVLALFAGELFGKKTGLLSAALLAVHPVHVTYSLLAEHFVLEWLLFVLAGWALWRWTRGFRWPDAAGWVVAAACLLLTSYYSYLQFATLVAFGVAVLRGDRRRLAQWLGLVVLALLLFSPWARVAWHQSASDIAEGLSAAPRPPSDLYDLGRKFAFSATWMIPVVLALCAAALLDPRSREGATYVLYLAAAPIVLTWVLNYGGFHIYIVRNQFFAVTLLCVLLACGALAIPWRWARTLVIAGLLAVGVRSWSLKGPLEEATQLMEATRYLQLHARPGDLVVCSETRALFFLRYHLADRMDARLLQVPGAQPLHYSDGTLVMTPDWSLSERAFLDDLARGRRWWGMRLSHAGRTGPLAAALMTMETQGDTLQFGRVTLWRGHTVRIAAPHADSLAGAGAIRPAAR